MSYKKYLHPWFWRDLWWNLRWGVSNLFRYKKIVWKMRPYDYHHILEMMHFQITELQKCVKNGSEEPDSKGRKVRDMQRVLDLLKHKIDDDFIKRQGGLSRSKYPFKFEPADEPGYSVLKEYRTSEEIEEDTRRVIASHNQELAECSELFHILAEGKEGEHGLYSWWD